MTPAEFSKMIEEMEMLEKICKSPVSHRDNSQWVQLNKLKAFSQAAIQEIRKRDRALEIAKDFCLTSKIYHEKGNTSPYPDPYGYFTKCVASCKACKAESTLKQIEEVLSGRLS